MEVSLLVCDPEGATSRLSRVHPGHPFSIILWGFQRENAIQARFGGARAETRYRKWPKTAVSHWEKDRSQGVLESIRKRGDMAKILMPSHPSTQFSPVMATKGPFGPFFGPEGVWGSIRNWQLLLEMGPTQLD